ncbi:MAG: ribosome-associated translation inhibitor RaiA [Campylobacterales bacterium]|jgi:putative sigma-54 modulation protein
MDYVTITGRNIELTETLKSHIENAVEQLKTYNLDIISVKVVVSAQEKWRNNKKGFGVEFIINMAKKNSIVVKQMDKDLHAAIDLAIDRAKKVLRRHHDKITDRRMKEDERPEELKGAEIAEEAIKESLGFVDELVPHNLDIDKPTEIEDAIAILKESAKHFIVFEDLEGKMRVLYKRTDGKFGLY